MQHWEVMLFSVLMLSVASGFKVSTPDYCYKGPCGPYMWGKKFSECIPSNKLHSPIDLNDAAINNDSIPPLELKGFDVAQSSWTVANVRDSVVVDFEKGMTVKGGMLKHEYNVVDMKFHWGTTTTNGSEHTLNNRRFPMEMQITGVAPGFADAEAAFREPSGVTIMGVFIDIAESEKHPFKAISDALVKVPYPGDSLKVTPPALQTLLPSKYTKIFYYQGGQTTPPCLQNVSWIVFEKPVFMSREEYVLFATSLYYSDKNGSEWKLEENYRPIQTNAERRVYSSTIKNHTATGAAQNQQSVFIPLLLLINLLPFDLWED